MKPISGLTRDEALTVAAQAVTLRVVRAVSVKYHADMDVYPRNYTVQVETFSAEETVACLPCR